MEFWRLFIAVVLVSRFLSVGSADLPQCEFPAIYNFGDSNSDTGAYQAAFEPIRAPSGVPFFHKPACEDYDGRLIIDFIDTEKVKLPYLRAYLNSLGANFRHGANVATGGSTIRRQNETIFQYGISPFALDMQILQFDHFKARTIDIYNQAKDPSEKDKLPRPEDFAKATINNTKVSGSSCANPSAIISWVGVHYSQAAKQFVADHILNGSSTDPPIPITQACRKQ